jgi:hypothetical protein
MTSNGIEKSRENPVALRALPVLKVLRDTWCSQQTADAAIDYLQAHYPALLQELLVEEEGSRSAAYLNAAYGILDTLSEDNVELPAAPLGKMDLMCELSRRLRKAYGFFDVPPRGRPLAAGPDQPLPKLPGLPVSEGSARRGKVTQEMADRVLQSCYDKHPALWFALAEEYRNQMPLYAVDEFRDVLARLVSAEDEDKRNVFTENELFIEAVRRIYVLCGIEE